ncbi:MAG TPA: hypothetical protein VM490_20360 [Armatimonadaceae bacterium]|nr:hypothetical protein [Armatimonadaceae bacterium]
MTSRAAAVAKTVAERMLVRPGSRLYLSHPERRGLLGPLPDGVTLVDGPEQAATAVLFADDGFALRGLLAACGEALLTGPGVLWVAYPRAGNRADINRDTLWPVVAERGLRPIAQVAVNDVWSALRFRPLRSGEEPFAAGAARR